MVLCMHLEGASCAVSACSSQMWHLATSAAPRAVPCARCLAAPWMIATNRSSTPQRHSTARAGVTSAKCSCCRVTAAHSPSRKVAEGNRRPALSSAFWGCGSGVHLARNPRPGAWRYPCSGQVAGRSRVLSPSTWLPKPALNGWA